jgi:hypothetical protein
VSAKAFSSCSTVLNNPIALFGAEQENHKSLEKLGSSLNLETNLRNSPLPHLEALSTNSLKLLEIKEYSSLQGAEHPEVYECVRPIALIQSCEHKRGFPALLIPETTVKVLSNI